MQLIESPSPASSSDGLHISRGAPTPDIFPVSCQLCVLRAGRKTFHPSVKPLRLAGPVGHGSVLRHGLKQQYLRLAVLLAWGCVNIMLSFVPPPPSGSSFWGRSITMTGFRSPYKSWSKGAPTPDICQLCILRAGRKTSQPSLKPLRLAGRQAMVASCAMA
ncbi:hypothetical protein QQF64_017155 [Cirrhinus molitorella]|uniref:Uncharacterized protein n=1 Tax=Cirrhinus molitorella TaxID=172907 RepID=A0ABR3LLI6_9TELE